MKFIQHLITTAVFWFVLIEYTKASNCSSPISWKEKPKTSFVLTGEWMLVNCTVNTTDDATLSFIKTKRGSKLPKSIHVDKNVFNITNVTIDDNGKYTCTVCNESREQRELIIGDGSGYLKAFIIKEPNKELHDLHGKVKLICTLDNSTGKVGRYDISWYTLEWYKLGSNGHWTKETGPNVKKLRFLPRGPKPKGLYPGLYLSLDRLTMKAEGIYKCVVRRNPVNYYDFQLVSIMLKEQFKPKILILNYKRVFSGKETEDFSLSYNVSSYPVTNISWWRSKDGVRYQLITRCLVTAQICEKLDKVDENITKTSFQMKDIKFPQDDLFYKLNATNRKGNDSKIFRIQILVRPEIEVREKTYIFKKGMIINCTLKRVNPPEVNYTWYSCDTANCGKDIAKWKPESRNYSLRIANQIKAEMKYRCIAINVAGKDESATIRVYKLPKSTTLVKTFLFVVVPIGIITMIILVATCFVLYRRKKIYGGFYLFSYPPLPDYMETLDVNGNMQEQLQKLPFVPEWEFPRERISFISELGSGEFGVVWLAEAIGISAFHPRDILKERESRRRFSFFNRMAKRNSYVCCKEVTKVAIKRTKENWDRGKLADLQSELKILIHVGENENIVNILGACTKGKSSNLWIILEYCPNGNLREFLRSSRNLYSVEEESLMTDISQVIGQKHLINFAWHIAKGMTFLISRKIIHRDLAARNILLGYGYTAKVGDFGLARDVYKYQAYLKNSSGLVPLKWMAIESIRDSIYTEKTDIWSFGILLWELFTLGGTPYPGMYANEVYQSLLHGKRMDPPVYCPEYVCNIMSKCWKENPNDRPDFETLKKILCEILGCEEITQASQQNEQIVNTYPNSPIESGLLNGEHRYSNEPFLESLEIKPI